MINTTKTTIIIPTYNEAQNIPELTRRIRTNLNGHYNYSVLFVDDSPDFETAREVILNCCGIIRGDKKGLSAAVIKGIEQVKQGNVIVMDADLQHPPEALETMSHALEEHDLVIAVRKSSLGWSLKRKIVSWGANLLALPLAPRVKDRTTGFFGFRREIVDVEKLDPIGWKIALEIMVKGKYKTMAQVPYDFGLRNKGESKLTGVQIKEYVKQLFRLYMKSKLVKFGIVGASGTVVGLGSLYLLAESGVFYYLAYAISFMLSLGNNYLWNTIWTFKQSKSFQALGKYAGVALFTLGINEGILYLLTYKLGVWYMLSAIVGIGTSFLANYILSRRIVWIKQKETL